MNKKELLDFAHSFQNKLVDFIAKETFVIAKSGVSKECGDQVVALGCAFCFAQGVALINNSTLSQPDKHKFINQMHRMAALFEPEFTKQIGALLEAGHYEKMMRGEEKPSWMIKEDEGER